MTAGEVSPHSGLMWWLDIDQHGHARWVARGFDGHRIAVASEHRLIVAIGSVPTNDMGLEGNDMWLCVNDVIVTALE
jgi:hypothetical protein